MYSEILSTSKPGLIVILIDQSGSMSDPYENSTKADFAALAVNRVIAEIITACTTGENVRDRCYIAAIGYATTTNAIFLDKVSELAKNSDIDTVKKKVSDGAGGLVEVDEIIRLFVKPTADGGTDMTGGFKEAYIGAEKFISKFPNSFPPVIINVTDGEPNDFESATVRAKQLSDLRTSDGNVILLNAHIAKTTAGKIELPNSSTSFSSDKFASFLFDISTVLPEALANRAKDTGFNVQTNARGFVFNADAEALIGILNFGSLGVLR